MLNKKQYVTKQAPAKIKRKIIMIALVCVPKLPLYSYKQMLVLKHIEKIISKKSGIYLDIDVSYSTIESNPYPNRSGINAKKTAVSKT